MGIRNRIFAALIIGTALGSAAGTVTNPNPAPEVHFLQRPQGRIAWSLHGDYGPLVIGMPGMGDLRENWNGFAAALAAKGYRVAVIDLRGQGRSDASSADVSREAMAQ